MRYPHYLRPATGGHWPARVLAVECESVVDEAVSGQQSQTERLVRWRCAELVLADSSYQLHSRSTGTSTYGWWQWLEAQLTDTRPTWIISESCGRVWPLIGLWEEIEHGRVTIAGRDPYTDRDGSGGAAGPAPISAQSLRAGSGSEVARARDRLSGMLVTADPPCILSARVGRAPARVTWVDARNYAVRVPVDIRRGADAIDWLVRFWRQYHRLCTALNLGSAQTTTGSQSLHGWRVGYYTGGVYAGGTPEVTDLETRALTGGRCECYRLGVIAGPVYHLDIRSAYADMCVREHVPIRIRDAQSNVRAETLAKRVRLSACIASVRIRTAEPAYPVRREHDVVYPVGEYDTVMCGPELEDAWDYGRVVKCYTLLQYDCAPILRDYASAVYGMRCLYEHGGNTEMASVCKALLTGIVGKFGQRDRRWTHCPGMWSDIMYGEWWGADAVGRGCRYRSMGGVVQRDDILGLSGEAVPAVSAWILSAARANLLRLIRLARWESVYYCDTDALMVDEAGYHRLQRHGEIVPGELGALYIHGVYDNVEIRGAKYYSADGRITCAGLPRGACVDAGDGLHYWYDDRASGEAARHCRPTSTRTIHQYRRRPDYHGGLVDRWGNVTPHRMG